MEPDSSRNRTPQRVTLKAVAKVANVSPITVSNVVNGRFQSMSAETRERVERVIEKLNYRANIAARGLRRSHHYCVALIVVDHRPAFLSHPAHHQIAAGLSNHLNAQGYAMAIEGVTPAQAHDLSYLDRLSTDALCLIPSGSQSERMAVLERLQAMRQPLVVFHEPPADGGDARTCHVRCDDRAGGRLIARHMCELGARRILLLLPRREWAPMHERALGVRSVLRSHKEARLRVLHVEGVSVPEVTAAMDEFLRGNEAPDAVVAGNDLLAAAAQRYFQRIGHRLAPGRMGGFGGFDILQYLDPPITTVRMPTYEMGQTAGREILAAVARGQFARQDVLLPVSLSTT